MLDIKLIRERPDEVKRGLVAVGAPATLVDSVLDIDVRRRALITDVERMRAQRGETSKTVGKLPPDERATVVAEMRALGDRISDTEREVAAVEAAFETAMLEIPNLPHPAVPIGADEHANRIVLEVGELASFAFEPHALWDLGTELGIIDFARGVKIAGSRFYVLRGAGARLQRALISWMVDLHVSEHGYSEVYPPAMVRTECLVGTGTLPKFGDTMYRDAEEEIWFAPTAEVTVTNMYREEILEAAQLPINHVAYSPCFRREKMSAGRDVRGIKRGHQFDKVEMVKFVAPETSDAELDQLLDNAEDVCRRLGLRHRVVEMCTGDLSFTAARKYDVEVWAPGCGEWLEVSSCSNFRDFQARRARIRYRPSNGAKPELVHTLNGSGLALPRVVIAVLETFQQADGTVAVPPVLRSYMGGAERIKA